MNKRILALVLIGLMAISMLSGCKSADDDASLDYGGNGQFGDDGIDNGDAFGDQEEQGSDNAGSDAQDQGGEDEKGNSSAGQGSESDKSNGSSQGNAGGSNQGGSSGLNETFDGGAPISVSAGETVWFGPASTAQKEQLTFTDKSGKTTKVTIDQLQKVDTFNNGFVIYSYAVAAAGSVSIQSPETYSDLFLASKESMDVNAYYTHWDSVKDRNLYVASLDKTNKQIKSGGKLEKVDDGGSTHAIPVKQGDTLTIAPVSPSALVQGCAYDSKMKVVAVFNGYELKEAFAFPQGKRAYTYTVPAGVSYVRFNVPEEERDTFLVMKNKEFDQSYYTRSMEVTAEHVSDPLYKMNCLFIGDSLCAASQDDKIDGQRGWARRVKELANANVYNAGRGGAALSTCRMTKEDATEYHTIYKQLTRPDTRDFDYVLIEGGANDAWETAPIGSVSPDYDPVSFDMTTYAGGLEMTIYTAIKEYGDRAAIGYLMTFQMPRNKHGVIATKMNDYYTVGKKICEKWNITYFDMYNHGEINRKLNPEGTEHVPDGTHADASGYDILGPYITDYMRSMTPATQKVRDEVAAIG